MTDNRPGRKWLTIETATPETQRLMFECFEQYQATGSIMKVVVLRDSGKPVCYSTVSKYVRLEAVRRGLDDSPVGRRVKGWQKKKFIDCKRDYAKYRDEGRLRELAKEYGISMQSLKVWGKELKLTLPRAGWPKGKTRAGQSVGRPKGTTTKEMYARIAAEKAAQMPIESGTLVQDTNESDTAHDTGYVSPFC